LPLAKKEPFVLSLYFPFFFRLLALFISFLFSIVFFFCFLLAAFLPSSLYVISLLILSQCLSFPYFTFLPFYFLEVLFDVSLFCSLYILLNSFHPEFLCTQTPTMYILSKRYTLILSPKPVFSPGCDCYRV